MSMYERINQIKSEVEKQYKIISEVNNWKYQMICLFSLMDSFAQEVAGYPSYGNKDAFCSFVKKYDKTFPYWDEVDTVSFFYTHRDLFKGNDPTSFMNDGAVYYCQQLVDRQEHDLFDYVDPTKYRKELDKHQYKMLFYILRNKLVHELDTPNGVMSTAKELTPFYISFSIITSKNQMDTWALTFPRGFVEQVVKSSINNYLDQCLSENKEPFQNSDLLRDYFINWVE